jgi:thymidylate synthase
MKDGFPLLTTKKMAWKSIVTELLWFLRGDTNIKYLVDNGCHIWDGDAYKYYCNNCKDKKYLNSLPLISLSKLESFIVNCVLYSQEEFINKIKTDDDFAKKWGDLGPVYGQMWRDWDTDTGEKIDQIANLINDLKTNPDGRRLMVSAWNPTYIPHCVLPPCHYGFQVYTRELSLEERREIAKDKLEQMEWADVIKLTHYKETYDKYNIPTRAISLMFNMRSVDTFLGLPFNIASYGLLLEIIAKSVNMVPDELIGNLGDVHLYSNHVEQAKEQIGRELTDDERFRIAYKDLELRKKLESESKMLYYPDGHNKVMDDANIPTRTRQPFPLPTLNIFEPAIGKKISILDNLHIWSPNCFIIENYQSHPSIKAPLSN